MKIRISLVRYLNAAPLGWSFMHGQHSDRFEVIPSSPARCAEQLANGEVDVGLIPCIEYQRIPGLQIIPGMAVAASTSVRSVLMVRKRNSGPIRSVALDTSSRTSVSLLKVLLWKRMGLNPAFAPHAPNLPEMLQKCDTALLIGDAALQLSPDDYEILDLAEAWIGWQGKPFVFAFWVCRQGGPFPRDFVTQFQQAKEWGLGRRPEIAANYAKTLNLPVQFLEDYLSQNIDYEMGPSHLDGLETFYRLAYESGLIPELKPLRFFLTPSSLEDGKAGTDA